MPIQLQTDCLLFLLSFLRDGVTKQNPREHIICMTDFVLTL